MFEFYMSTKVFYGAGSRHNIIAVLKDNRWSAVGIVVDHNIIETEPVKNLIVEITKVCKKVVIGLCTISEPTYDFLENIRSDFDDTALQAIIGIGGGSALDTAKAMAVLVNNKKPTISYRGFNMMTEPVLPVIAVPTTAGTGSEITPNASFIDAAEKKKLGINGEAIRPKYAVLDPELTLSCPESASISAGVDSMVHAVEAYVAKKTNPMAKMFAREGFRHVFVNLPLVVKEPENISLREKVMYGAFLSGVALMNSGTGPAAALSYPLGVHLKVPHGIGGGIFLPHVVKHNVNKGCCLYSDLYDSIATIDRSIPTEEERAAFFIERMFSVWKDLSIPDDLAVLGLQEDFVPQFVKETLDLKGALDQNPVPFYEKEILSVLKMLNVNGR